MSHNFFYSPPRIHLSPTGIPSTQHICILTLSAQGNRLFLSSCTAIRPAPQYMWNHYPSNFFCLLDLFLNKLTHLPSFHDTCFFFDVNASMLAHIPCHKSLSWSLFFFVPFRPVSLFLLVHVLSSLPFSSVLHTCLHINLSLTSTDLRISLFLI